MSSDAPDQLAPQQHDSAMTGFNGLEAGVDVSASLFLSLRSAASNLCSSVGFVQHAVQWRSQQSGHTREF